MCYVSANRELGQRNKMLNEISVVFNFRSSYSFDVNETADGKNQYLSNKRLFTWVHTGLSDGLKVDTEGNLVSLKRYHWLQKFENCRMTPSSLCSYFPLFLLLTPSLFCSLLSVRWRCRRSLGLLSRWCLDP